MPIKFLKRIHNYLNNNNNLSVALLSLCLFLVGIFLPSIFVYLEGEGWHSDIFFLSAFYPLILAFQMLWEKYVLLAILALGLYIYPALLLLGLASQDDDSSIYVIKLILSIIFAIVLFVFFIHAFPTMSNWEFKQYFGNNIYHSHYWIFCAFAILPIYQVLKGFLIEIDYRVFIVLFVLGYGAIGYLQYQKYLTANELEREKYFNKHILYTFANLSNIEYVPLPEMDIDYDTVIELSETPKPKDDKAVILQNYQRDGLFFQSYDVCFGSPCPSVIKVSTAKQPNYYLAINRTDNKIDYLLLDSHKNKVWQASSIKIETYDKFYNKEQVFHPDYDSIIKDKFKLYNPLLIGHKDIIIHYNDYDKSINNEQKKASNQLKETQLSKVFEKNSPFYKGDTSSDCHFNQHENNYIQLNGNFFRYISDDLNHYELWCSSDYYVLIKPKLSHLWGQNQYAFLIDRKTNTPLLVFAEFGHILSEIVPNQESISQGNNGELLQQYPNGFKSNAISFKISYYDKQKETMVIVDKKEQLPSSNANYFWYTLVVHTEFGDILYRTGQYH